VDLREAIFGEIKGRTRRRLRHSHIRDQLRRGHDVASVAVYIRGR